LTDFQDLEEKKRKAEEYSRKGWEQSGRGTESLHRVKVLARDTA